MGTVGSFKAKSIEVNAIKYEKDNMKTAEHPVLPFTISFESEHHIYRDQEGTQYTSGTEFVKRFFEPFDAPAAAERIAARDGRLALDILAEWKAKGEAAATAGNIVHAYAESLLNDFPIPDPSNPEEARTFGIVDRTMEMLIESGYEPLGAEQLIFDPLYHIATQIDLPCRNTRTGALAILDWKTCESITLDNYGRMALSPIAHVPDCKVEHYTLQLSLTAWLLTEPGYTSYPSEGEPVELALIHVPHVGEDPVWRPLAYRGAEITAMVDGQQTEMVNGSSIREE